MATPDRLTTTVSTKGQVILPKAIRQALRWEAGTRLVVLESENGVMLKPLSLFAETKSEDVFGCLTYDGPPKTIEEMDAAVLAEAAQRHASGRY